MSGFSDPILLSLIGVGISAALGAIGSSIGCGAVGTTATGLLSKEPHKFPQALVLMALPTTQSLYGLLFGFVILLQTGLLTGGVKSGLTEANGWQFLASSIPVGIACLISGAFQGKVAAAGIKILAEKAENLNQAIVLAAILESFAIFGLVISLLTVFVGIQIPA